MATLAETAAELVPEVAGIEDAQERAARLAQLIDEAEPGEWKVRSRQTAAARAVGAETPAELSRRASEATKPRSRKRGRKRRRLRSPRIRVAPASSFGSLFAQMLGLVLFYWVVRHGGAVAEILERIGSAVRSFIDPVGWFSQSSNNP